MYVVLFRLPSVQGAGSNWVRAAEEKYGTPNATSLPEGSVSHGIVRLRGCWSLPPLMLVQDIQFRSLVLMLRSNFVREGRFERLVHLAQLHLALAQLVQAPC